jgi:hypothetical protein
MIEKDFQVIIRYRGENTPRLNWVLEDIKESLEENGVRWLIVIEGEECD